MCDGHHAFPRIEEKLAVLGSGIIAGVWMKRLLAAGVIQPQQIMACDVRHARLLELAQGLGVRTHSANSQGAEFARVVILAHRRVRLFACSVRFARHSGRATSLFRWRLEFPS